MTEGRPSTHINIAQIINDVNYSTVYSRPRHVGGGIIACGSYTVQSRSGVI